MQGISFAEIIKNVGCWLWKVIPIKKIMIGNKVEKVYLAVWLQNPEDNWESGV